MDKTKKNFKKNLFSIISIVSCTIIMITFLFTPQSLTGLALIAKQLKPQWLIFATISMAVGFFSESLSIHILSRDVMKNWSFFDSFQIGMVGLFYNGVTPFASGGQPMQIYVMRQKGMDAGYATSVIAKRSVIFQVALVLYAVILMALQLPFFASNVSNFVWLALFGVISNATYIFFIMLFALNEKLTKKIITWALNLLEKIHIVKNRQKINDKIENKLVTFHDGILKSEEPMKVYPMVIAVTIVQLLSTCFIPYCIYKSFSFSGASVLSIFAADAFVTMVAAFMPLPGSSGGAEGSFFLFFNLFFTNGTIIPAILLWRMFTYYSHILVGGIVSAIKPDNHHRKEKVAIMSKGLKKGNKQAFVNSVNNIPQ